MEESKNDDLKGFDIEIPQHLNVHELLDVIGKYLDPNWKHNPPSIQDALNALKILKCIFSPGCLGTKARCVSRHTSIPTR